MIVQHHGALVRRGRALVKRSEHPDDCVATSERRQNRCELRGTGDTVRMRRPRVDLRKLSEWIKTTNQVKASRKEEEEAQQPLPDKE